MEKLKIGVLLSGSGTNLQAIIDEIANGLPVEIVHVLSSRPDAYGIERARIAAIMQEAGVEYLVMAGYMRKLTPVVLDAFPDHVLNLHPALLPSFKGAHAIQDAWDAGVKVTGVTVHLANEDYDKGPIVAQRAVPVLEDDDIDALEARIHETEHIIYPEVLRAIAEGRMTLDADRKIHIRSVD